MFRNNEIIKKSLLICDKNIKKQLIVNDFGKRRINY